MTKNYVQIQKKLEQAHPGYAYELLQLQMAVEDDKISNKPSISQITKLIQLYMLGVEVLESVADPRYSYFNNKIHSLMLKKHIAAKLHESTGKNPKDLSMTAMNKAELKQKKDKHQMNCFYNNGLVDKEKVKEILLLAEKRNSEYKGKIKDDLKKQEDRLEERIKFRKMRSETGSRKSKVDSEEKEEQNNFKDSRNEYFEQHQPGLISSARGSRPLTGSLQKIIQRKYGRLSGLNRQDPRDAI